MTGLLCAESLNLDLVKVQVTGCWYKQTHVRGATSRPFVSLRLFFFGGGVQKVFHFLCFGIKSIITCIYTLNGFRIWVFFNTESLNARGTHFKKGFTNTFQNEWYGVRTGWDSILVWSNAIVWNLDSLVLLLR